MDSRHFLTCIDQTASLLREALGNIISNISLLILPLTYLGQHVKIVLIIDNATWHNQLAEDTIPPKRVWRKDLVLQWLVNHNIRVRCARFR
jgi:hypothetical protein